MASDLSPHLHSDECNVLIDALHKCHADHFFGRFVGRCNEFDTAVQRCVKKELLDKREANRNRKQKRKQESQREEEGD